jgi:hypothetical protein
LPETACQARITAASFVEVNPGCDDPPLGQEHRDQFTNVILGMILETVELLKGQAIDGVQFPKDLAFASHRVGIGGTGVEYNSECLGIDARNALKEMMLRFSPFQGSIYEYTMLHRDVSSGVGIGSMLWYIGGGKV